jgi:mono/diheme cytochrome c family protein
MNTLKPSRFSVKRFGQVGWLALSLLLILSGCVMNMRDQPKMIPLRESTFFEDGRSARPLLVDTVARDHLRVDRHLYTGQTEAGEFVTEFPFDITRETLERGQERYDIFCAPCHGAVGYGQGMIVQRGMPRPPSFHDERLLEAENGYYFSVMTNGFGKMYSYASRIPTQDRWAIVAYIRALQRSQNATLSDVPPDKVEELESSEPIEQ